MGWEIVHKYVPPCSCKDVYRALHAGLIGEHDIVKCTDCGNQYECYMTSGGMQWDPEPRVLALRIHKEPPGRIQGR